METQCQICSSQGSSARCLQSTEYSQSDIEIICPRKVSVRVFKWGHSNRAIYAESGSDGCGTDLLCGLFVRRFRNDQRFSYAKRRYLCLLVDIHQVPLFETWSTERTKLPFVWYHQLRIRCKRCSFCYQ